MKETTANGTKREIAPTDESVYDHTYDGPRWKYGCKFRPPSFATVPNGRIIFADKRSSYYRFGTIEFPFELDEQERQNYELEFVEFIPSESRLSEEEASE